MAVKSARSSERLLFPPLCHAEEVLQHRHGFAHQWAPNTTQHLLHARYVQVEKSKVGGVCFAVERNNIDKG
jgi:hypothetical protein